MKKIFIFFCFCLSLLVFCSCSTKIQRTQIDQNLDYKIAYLIDEIDKTGSYDDEILKALSVIIRTNIINGNLETPKLASSFSKGLKISKQTSGEILSVPEKQGLNVYNTPENYTWKREIKNSELLEFLNKHNISLANLKNIEPSFDKNNNFAEISFGGKKIDYFLLKKEFGLESSKITDIKRERSSIVIFGEGKDMERLDFELTKAKKLSKEGKNYKQLLNYFYNDFHLKTIA